MKAKVFVSQVSHKKDDKKPIDYWGLLFVGIILIVSFSCFLFDTYQENLQTQASANIIQPTQLKHDLDHHIKV
ncbi:hypothetical protein MSP8887_00663 [Marinomonas spartinae]|uniref:Uncharacterized protein n=1 Tax=Marinomonas spartinae TaxID=1792290 RepID=A0A1A8T811_9GAMM|nr:hypothetical protein [Marinomonas spartinae]SBS27500.1 hypothetical protein MSP8887_00663 [Marinomonas spartinae]SBS28760.1 hypothetical protein MSP8886_01304 [Marinomonas spartinae]